MRSMLFVPGDRPDRFAKAAASGADAVILDLEDAVTPDMKGEARENAVAAVRAGGFGTREVVIRVNALGTPWADENIVAAATSGADAILAPKVGDAETVRRYHQAMAAAPAGTGFWAMVESSRAIFRLDQIAETIRPGHQ